MIERGFLFMANICEVLVMLAAMIAAGVLIYLVI